MKLDRWAKLQFNLEHPWDQFVSDFLAEHELESTEFDAALGTIGGGNHFAEFRPSKESSMPVNSRSSVSASSNSSCWFTAVRVVG